MDEDKHTNIPPPLNGVSVLPYLNSIGGKWRNLGRHLNPRVPDSKLDEINYKISSDEEGIVEVIDSWINAEGILQPWRQLISALDWISETTVADKMMKFPKPFTYHNEHTFNVENVSKVYSLIRPGKIREATNCGVFFAPARHDAFEKAHEKHQDRANAYASYAVNCHEQGSWTSLAAGLYHAAEVDALDYALTFLSERGTATQLLFTVEDISDILIQWAHHENWKDVFSEKDNSFGISLIGKHQLDMLEGSHESMEEICHACASYYINYYPGPTERFMDLSKHKAGEATSLNALNPYLQSKEFTVTAERLLQALREVKSEDWDKIGKGLYISRFKREKIRETHDTVDEQMEALLRTYANEQSHTTWWEVCSALRMNDYQELADKIKTKYIAPKFTQKDMMLVVSQVNPQNRMSLVLASPVPVEQQNTAQDYESLSQEQYATLYMQRHPKTSWYYLIRDLYNMGETAAVKRLQNFVPAKTSDSTLSAENVYAVLSKLSLRSWKNSFATHYRGVSLIPPSQLKEIDKKFKVANECIHACAEYYVDYHPEASWIHLTAWIHAEDCMSSLDSRKELKQVYEMLKQYLPPADPLLTFENLCVALLFEENAIEKDIQHIQYWDEHPTPTLCEENANEKDLQHIHDWGELVHCLKIPDHVIDITLTSFTDESYIRRISLEYFVHDHPLKSWWLVYRSLQRVGHLKQARYVKTTYIDVIKKAELTPESHSESDLSKEDEESTGKFLTKEVVLQYIQSIENIRDKLSKLSRQLLGYGSESWTNEEEIVKMWLVSEDASWRSLVYALDKMGETDVANTLIKDDRMEQVNVATMTTANVKAVFSLLLNMSVKEYFQFEDVPRNRADVIERGYPDPEVQDHAITSYYVKCFPTPTWEVHACRLYIYDEIAALDKLYTFHQRHQKDTTFTTENVLTVMIHWAPEDWKHTFSYCSVKKDKNGYQMPLVLPHKFDSIEKTYCWLLVILVVTFICASLPLNSVHDHHTYLCISSLF